MRRPEVVERIKQALREVAPTATVILYGSEARGDARPDSDIDLLILVDSQKPRLEWDQLISASMFQIELDTMVQINPLVIPRPQWENRPFKTPFYINVINEGIPLQS